MATRDLQALLAAPERDAPFEGGSPLLRLAVVALEGCTATGAFDALEVIAHICHRSGILPHIDGAPDASALAG